MSGKGLKYRQPEVTGRYVEAWDAVPDSELQLEPELAALGLRTSSKQLNLLERFRDYYRSAGLLPNGSNPPLWDCCPDGPTCWSGLNAAAQVAKKAGITLPWIGPDYHRSRIAVVAHNLRDNGGLLVEQRVTSDVRAGFQAGRKEVHNTVFAYRSFSAADAVLARAESRLAASDGKPDPESLVRVVDAVARVQAVKCAPKVWQSTPSEAMAANCPPRYLKDELQLLAPRTVIALGRPVREGLQRLFPGEWQWSRGLSRGRIGLGRGECEVFCIAHPSARSHWWPSYCALTQALTEPQSTPI